MQTVIQVITSGRGSLREKIMTDPQLRKFDLIPTEHQRPGRPHGWAKIHSETAHGAINLEWHGRTGVLTCRVVTKLGNKPNSIIGDFIDYLLARHQSRILVIHIMRRCNLPPNPTRCSLLVIVALSNGEPAVAACHR